MARLDIEGVSKLYGSQAAVRDVSVAIADGEFVTLLGPSGSGKTTLLMIVAGFVEPSAGRVLVDGRDVTGLPPERRDFGMVFQGYALFPHLSVEGNVGFPLAVRGTPGAEAAAKVKATLEQVRLGALARRRPSQLSGGQQQRVALARALVFAPRLLLLDEPLSALDKNLREEMQGELKDLHRRTGVTFIHVTHDQDEALAMSDRIVLLNAGAIEQVGPPRELYRRPRSRFVAGFLGDNNLIPATVRGRDGARLRLEALGAGILAAGTDAGWRPGDAVTIALRPEHVTLARERGDQDNAVAARVADTVYRGSREVVLLEAGGRQLAAHVAAAAEGRWRPGEQVWLGWSAEDMHLLAAESAG
jgi:putative spermidine/putrescine transport system ATP-binding protein